MFYVALVVNTMLENLKATYLSKIKYYKIPI